MDDGETAEVSRLCTDGTAQACSFLYSRSAQAARALGYRRIVTYILHGTEPGISLRAAGWVVGMERTDRRGSRRHNDAGDGRPKQRWDKVFREPLGDVRALTRPAVAANTMRGVVLTSELPQHVWARTLLLPAVEKVILYTLVSHASGKTTCFPGLETLATETGLHRATVIRGLAALDTRGRSASTAAPDGTTSTTFPRPNPSHRTTGRRALPVAQGDGGWSHRATGVVAQDDPKVQGR